MSDSDTEPTEGNTRTTRRLPLPRCLSSGPASAFAVFCIGLLSGFGGGLLLGRTTIVLLRSLELLADNDMLMQQLNNYTVHNNLISRKISQRTDNGPMFNIYISVLSNMFGFVTSNLSFLVGIFVGWSVYNLVIRKYGATAMGKAFALAGPGCLMGITATGYLLGGAFQAFLEFISAVSFIQWFIPSVISIVHVIQICFTVYFCCGFMVASIVSFLTPLNTPVLVSIVVLLSLVFKTKLVLGVDLIPIIVFGMIHKDTYDIRFTANHLPLMLTVTEVFSLARLPVVTPQSQTHKGSLVLEDIFIGVLTSQFLTVAAGMSLFVIYQRGGAAKVCAGAVTSGAAVIAVIESVLPVLGPGPTVGALTGVAGAVGVTLAAAGATADSYGEVIGRCGLVGRLGVTVGAAVGAFLISGTNNGLSAIFMALCAASIPAGLYLTRVFSFFLWKERCWKLKLCLCIIITILLSVWVYLTCTQFGAIMLAVSVIIILMSFILCNYSRWLSGYFSSS